eukprot:9790578-Heterocapsa_arctica.AAC.1
MFQDQGMELPLPTCLAAVPQIDDMPATNTIARSASSVNINTNSVNINNSIVMGNTSALAAQGPHAVVPPPLGEGNA